jgi:hypothetical protein
MKIASRRRLVTQSLLSALVALPLLFGCGKSAENQAEAESAEPAKNGPQPDSPQSANTPGEKAAASTALKDSETSAPAKGSAAPATSANDPAPAETPAADSPVAPKEKPKIDDVVREPATAAEAAAAIDLRKLPVPTEVEDPALAIATAYYETKQDEKSAFDTVAKFFTDNGCKIYSDVQAYPGSISAGYTRDGFRFVVNVIGAGGRSTVMIHNRGNVNLAKLPVPAGAKEWHSFPDTAAFITNAGVEETRAAMKTILVEKGWQAYGGAADTRDYKKNATSISVTISSPPATPGQTVITFGSEQHSADLPAPPDATRVDYSENPIQLYVEMPGSPKEAFAFNQKTFSAMGWKATTDTPIEEGNVESMIFRNDAKDMLTLTVRPPVEDRPTNYSLEYSTGEEVAKREAKIKKLIAERKKKQEEEEKAAEAERNKPKPKAAIVVPAGATEVEADEDGIEFKVKTGQGRAAYDAIVKALEADGWKAKVNSVDNVNGTALLEKDDNRINVNFVDAGAILPTQVSVSSFDIDLEKK